MFGDDNILYYDLCLHFGEKSDVEQGGEFYAFLCFIGNIGFNKTTVAVLK